MTVTFDQAMYLCGLAAIGGAVLALAAQQSIRAWREAGEELDADESIKQAGISHIPVLNTRPMSEKMAEHLRENLPGFKEMEAARKAADAHAEKVRREAMMAKPVEAGMAEVS